MQKFAQFSDKEERSDYIRWTLDAVEVNCNVCSKLIGYWDGWREDYNKQEHAMFFCVKCRQLAQKEGVNK